MTFGVVELLAVVALILAAISFVDSRIPYIPIAVILLAIAFIIA